MRNIVEKQILYRMTSQDMKLYKDLCSEEPRQLEVATRLLTSRVKRIAFRIVLSNSGDRSDIDDLVQDSVLAVWQQMNAGRFEARPNRPLDAYLNAVVRNKWLKILRERSVTVLTELDDSLIDEVPPAYLRLSSLEEAFTQLGEGCQRLLRLFYWEGYSLYEISHRLGISEDAAKMRKFRCMLRLEEKIRTEKRSE
jgi:RNA polymerase sigma factor (sigma-70 family)